MHEPFRVYLLSWHSCVIWGSRGSLMRHLASLYIVWSLTCFVFLAQALNNFASIIKLLIILHLRWSRQGMEHRIFLQHGINLVKGMELSSGFETWGPFWLRTFSAVFVFLIVLSIMPMLGERIDLNWKHLVRGRQMLEYTWRSQQDEFVGVLTL